MASLEGKDDTPHECFYISLAVVHCMGEPFSSMVWPELGHSHWDTVISEKEHTERQNF